MSYPIHNNMVELCQELLNEKQITSQRVYDVVVNIDRADFTQIRPYQNRAQPIPCNVVISAPHLHGYCLENLKDYLTEGSNVLDIGFGSGLFTLYMSKMMNDKGCVVGIEHMEELCELGKTNISKHNKDLLDNKKIILIKGDGRLGYKEKAPYKCIHVGAVSKEPPKALLEQLAIGGRLLIPLGTNDNNQYIHFIDRFGENDYRYSIGWSVNYVALTSVNDQLKKSD